VSRVTVGMVNLVAVEASTKRFPHRRTGGILPLSIAAMDPPPESRDAVARTLAAGDAVLSDKTAAMRGLRVGSSLTIENAGMRKTFRVGVIADEKATRGREVIVPIGSAGDLGLTAPRALVASVDGAHSRTAVLAIEQMTAGVLARLHTGDEEFADPSEGPILSFGEVKEIFGEFTFKPRSGLFVSIDKAWKEANIVQTRLPLLGLIKCNERLLPQLTAAMRELQARGLGSLVHYDGCFSPRMQVGNSYALSRHAYGIAVDINAAENRYGERPNQDPRLVETMERWGFTWGGRWLVPDGMHFEFVRFVSPA
jgi:D-alanyl-D-alanine carboxypeptidase-like protein